MRSYNFMSLGFMIMGPESVNHHPWTHQLAVLSMGWAWIFSSNSWPCVNPHCTTVNLFWLLIFDRYFLVDIFSGYFCPQPWPLHYPPTYLPFSYSYPANLHLGPIYKLTLNPRTYPPYLVTIYVNLCLLSNPLYIFG